MATLLAMALGRNAPVYGPVVFTGGADPEGSTRGLEPGMCGRLLTAAGLAAADCARLVAVTVEAAVFASRFR